MLRKRVLVLGITVLTAISMVACGKEKNAENDTTSEVEATTEASTTEKAIFQYNTVDENRK